MLRLIRVVSGLACLLLAPISHAQIAWINLEPAGGATIQRVAMRSDGYVIVLLAETFSETQGCVGTSDPAWGSLLGAPNRALWIRFDDAANFPTAKQLYSGLLAAYLTGKKLEQVVFTAPWSAGGACYIRGIRVGP